jgi:hypothetical protein
VILPTLHYAACTDTAVCCKAAAYFTQQYVIPLRVARSGCLKLDTMMWCRAAGIAERQRPLFVNYSNNSGRNNGYRDDSCCLYLLLLQSLQSKLLPLRCCTCNLAAAAAAAQTAATRAAVYFKHRLCSSSSVSRTACLTRA